MKTDTGENNESNSSLILHQELWVLNFMNKRQNRYLERVQDSFIQDRFNLHGLSSKIDNFEDAYLAIVDQHFSTNYESEEKLYLLIHQRYIFSPTGAGNVLDRVLAKEYGSCPRFGCNGTFFIPVGVPSENNEYKTMLYCYNCNNAYEPKGSLKKLNGLAWGPYFPFYLILSFPQRFKKKSSTTFIPKLFGFELTDFEDSNLA